VPQNLCPTAQTATVGADYVIDDTIDDPFVIRYGYGGGATGPVSLASFSFTAQDFLFPTAQIGVAGTVFVDSVPAPNNPLPDFSPVLGLGGPAGRDALDETILSQLARKNGIANRFRLVISRANSAVPNFLELGANTQNINALVGANQEFGLQILRDNGAPAANTNQIGFYIAQVTNYRLLDPANNQQIFPAPGAPPRVALGNIFDSGSPRMEVPLDVYNALIARLGAAVLGNDNGLIDIDCNSVASGAMPSLQLIFGANTITLFPEQLIRRFAANDCTLEIKPASIAGEPVIGLPFYRSALVTHDLRARMMFFQQRIAY
jgi:hypothetical protein